MQYVCLCYTSEAEFERLPRHELEAVNIGQVEYDAELRKSGHVIASEALEPVAAATTIRIRNGHLSVTDGPFAETKEQLGGFFLIEAADLNDAIRIASRFPSVRYGSMEIRPVWPIREYVRQQAEGSTSAGT